MNPRILTLSVMIALAGGVSLRVDAAAPADADADAVQKKIDQKVAKLLDAAQLSDSDKAAKVRPILSEWLGVMLKWHGEHDVELAKLWGHWNQARSVVPKDEFPGEIVAYQIDEVYASLEPLYMKYLNRLAGELTGEQIDALKEHWSRSPGMKRTYEAYLEIVPDLSEKDKQVDHERLEKAREAAMLTDSDREIVAIYKRHKVKVEQYIGTLEWAKLHKAFAERGKPATTPAK